MKLPGIPQSHAHPKTRQLYRNGEFKNKFLADGVIHQWNEELEI